MYIFRVNGLRAVILNLQIVHLGLTRSSYANNVFVFHSSTVKVRWVSRPSSQKETLLGTLRQVEVHELFTIAYLFHIRRVLYHPIKQKADPFARIHVNILSFYFLMFISFPIASLSVKMKFGEISRSPSSWVSCEQLLNYV